MRSCIKCKLPKEDFDFPKTKFYKINTCKLCINLRNRKYKKSPGGRFNRSVDAAKYKKLEWNISFEDYNKLIAQPCYYCEYPTEIETIGGLDRLDNSKGYLLENVVSCCLLCNNARRDFFTPEEMKRLGKVFKEFKDTGTFPIKYTSFKVL